MKYLSACFLLLALLLTAPALHAQTSPATAAARYEYCELHLKSGDVFVDFGFGPEKLGGGSLSKLEAGKLQVFATHISALNYMGSLGWDVVQVYGDVAQGNLRNKEQFFMLRRLRSSQGVNVSK
ncbi:hypothetical protein KBK19_15700 [Microvirga sp. STR05]|uniref:Uncharacterized protein n=1 Tax=Hymenobacter duratus TaxID=2771356 RepID=A0ABR8JL83_9BACT|nr:hypothetical protein [Hymenobacter duratus]MBD2716486.1 hypothetical protein [Hymenobacter duratus]MBR7951401.1 hypothetical protein [Microvirga sp. STR05]